MSEKLFDFIERNSQQVIFALLVSLVLVIYWQTVGFEFINFDDNIYVYENPFVTGGLSADGTYWAFTKFYSANWHPLTWITHQFDVSMFGMNAGSHHATNVFLHLINTILAYSVFNKLTDAPWKSAFIAALFAVHPVHIESVVWISERKDVLSTMFWLLTMFAYAVYAQRRKSELGSFVPYCSAILFFAFGLMSKPMLVTLPFVLLLIDYWPSERFKSFRNLPKLIIEKLPFLGLSIVSAVITVLAQRSGGAVQSLEMLPFGTRLLNAIVSYAKYIGKLFYPVNLSVWYPYDKSISTIQFLTATVMLIAISALFISRFKTQKYLLVGWLWFIGTLVPVIGLVQVGLQSYADRYTYVPYFGLFIILVFGASDIAERFQLDKKLIGIVAASIIVLLVILSFIQTSYWKNDETLFNRSISVTTANYLLMQNLCHALILKERYEEAEAQCQNTLYANPEYSPGYNSLGIIQIKQKQFEDAAESFRRSVKFSPEFVMYRVNLAVAYAELGNTAEAEANLSFAASKISYEANREVWIDAIVGLARAFTRENNFEKSSEYLRRALVISPERSDIRVNLALSLLSQKQVEEAQKQIEISLSQSPQVAESHNIYGMILLEQKKHDQAILEFEKALQLKPELKEAALNIEKARKVNNK